MATRRIDLRIGTRAIVALVALLACGMAAADPPARVARMANIGGPVSFSPAGEDEWVLATANRPLITGDRVWADAGARAELQIGSLAVRLGSQTSITILNLDDRVAQFQVAQGALNVRVRRMDPGQTVEVDTPLLALSLRRPGIYRIDVDAASAATSIAVVNGEGEAYGEGAAYTISEGQWYRFADSALRDYQYDALPRADAFDAWTQERDRREDNPVAARYVSPDVIGYSDLDEYGTWSTVEGYGNVWVPTSVASDWSPYREGRWAWIEPWGWTWVDDAPWGFAPFHYGRWAYARERWCWVPGPARGRAVYAPALVAFVGGDDFRVSVGAGAPARGIAWFPLAPGEVYRPSYRVSRNYFTRVNVSNTNVTQIVITNVYNRPDAPNTVYRNRDQRGGVTAMPAAAFAQSRPVAQTAVAISRAVATAGPVTPVAAIAPLRASVLGSGAGAAGGAATGPAPGSAARPPLATLRRPVVARLAPPAPPAPFNSREATLAKDPGRPADPTTLVVPRSIATAAPAVKVLPPSTQGTPPPLPTLPRARTNAPPPAASGGPLAAPSSPSGPVLPPRAATSAPAVPLSPAAPPQAKPPVRPDSGGLAPKTDIAPPSPPAIRLPPPPPASPPPPPPVQQAPQPPKVPEARPAQPVPQSGAPSPPAPAAVELRRERAPTPTVNNPSPSPPPPPEIRREAPARAAPPVSGPPVAPQPAELRREPSPSGAVAKPPVVPAVPAQQVVRPPPAPVAPAASVVRQPEAKAQPAKSEAQKAKADEKRDEPK